MAVSHRAGAAAIRLKQSLLGLALASCLCCATTAPLERRAWWGVETPRFEVVSSLGEKPSLALALDLERFVLASEALLGTRLVLPSGRIRVYAYNGKGFERPFDLSNQPSYFLPAAEGGTLVLRTGSGFQDATESARADLLRYLVRNSGSPATPLWYDIGFAGFLSTAQPEGRRVVVGEPRRDLLAVLRDQVWASSDDVLATRSLNDGGRRDRAVFEARTWALVYFLHFGGRLGGAPRTQLDAALLQNEPGEGTALDWFGAPASLFDRELRRYVSSELGSQRLVVRVDEALRFDEPRQLDCKQVGDALGRLGRALDRPGVTKKYLDFAAHCSSHGTVPRLRDAVSSARKEGLLLGAGGSS